MTAPKSGRTDPLILAAQGGDERARHSLLVHLTVLLERRCSRLAAAVGLDPVDLLQDVAEKVLRGFEEFAGDLSDFDRWAQSITTNAYIDAYRKAARRPGMSGFDFDQLSEAPDASEETIAATWLNSLPVELAHLLVLRGALRLPWDRVVADMRISFPGESWTLWKCKSKFKEAQVQGIQWFGEEAQ